MNGATQIINSDYFSCNRSLPTDIHKCAKLCSLTEKKLPEK